MPRYDDEYSRDSSLTPQQRWRLRHPDEAKQLRQRAMLKDAEKNPGRQYEYHQRPDVKERDRSRSRQKYADSTKRKEQRDALRKAEQLADPVAYDRKRADIQMRSKYKRSIADYDTQLITQHGKCATCPKTEGDNGRRLFWDHDHACCPGTQTCGKCVRGLLCASCNWLVGHLEADRTRVVGCLNYLEGWA